jgi:hypothetical protein
LIVAITTLPRSGSTGIDPTADIGVAMIAKSPAPLPKIPIVVTLTASREQ